jgi:DNA-binding LacI/PurR family transcriptional regulator
MKQKVTIRDVANYLGVSPATVSYVVNGVNKVSEETKEKVLDAIKQLNYQPDFTAISLSKKKSNMIGVMIPLVNNSIAPIFKENHYYAEVIGGMEYAARKHRYDLLISGIRDPEDCKNWVSKRNLDGLVFSGGLPENLYQELSELNIPIVLIDNYDEHGKVYHNIRIDDELGGYLVAKHLIDFGHEHISFVGHNLADCGSVEWIRLQGFKKALHEAAIAFDDNLIINGSGSSFEIGYNIGNKLLTLGKKITAIFATSDILAVGIINALRENGKDVPKDYSIIGFDDLEISRYLSPRLSTVKQDVFNKGAVSIQTLIDAIESKITNPVRINLPIELLVRESTGHIE